MESTLYLTNQLRTKLKKPFGIPVFGTEKKVLKKIKEILRKRKIKKIVTVGDYCSLKIPSDI